MIGRIVVIAAVLGFVPVAAAHAATADVATAQATPGPYVVGEPITFTSTTPCTAACRLIWTYLDGTRLGDALGEGENVTTSFATPGLKTVRLRLTETCVGSRRRVCDSLALVSVDVEPAPAGDDTTAPTFVLSGLQTEATGPSTPVNYTFEATDPDDAVVSQSCTPEPGSLFAIGSSPVTCTATDSHGNVGTQNFDVVVSDTTGPALTVPDTATNEATSPAGAVVAFAASAVDLVDGAVPPTCSSVSGSTFPLGSTSVACTATDALGNASSTSFDVVVTDTTAPALTLPAAIAVDATSPAGAAVTYAATASDVVDEAVTPTCSPASGSVFAIGTTAVSCTASDAHGNTSAAQSFFVQVRSAATANRAAAEASPGPYVVGEPITFTSTTPCTAACRLIWTFLDGTRLGDALGEGDSVTTSFDTPGLKTVELRHTEFCVGSPRLVCSKVAVVSVDVQAAPDRRG